MEVHQGTSSETYSLWVHQFNSVGCPTWIQDCPADVFRMFAFNLDEGPDHVGALRLIKRHIRDNANVAFWAAGCSFHKCHKIDESLARHLDAWSNADVSP